MKPCNVLVAFLSLLALPPLAVSDQQAQKPNVIVILADDLGYSDLGCFGSEINTPNIDRIAQEGITFTQFYNAARCNPTRAALLTGRYPHQTDVGFSDVGIPGYRGRLNLESVTIAEILQRSGYRTLMSGKWHLGHEPEQWPVKRGFDRFFGLIGGAGSFWEVLPDEQYQLALDDQIWNPAPEDDFYFTEAITDHALEFIDEAVRENNPFFLYLSYTAPHWPLHARSRDIAKYRGSYLIGWDALRERRYARQLELGIADESMTISRRDDAVQRWDRVPEQEKDKWDLLMSVYAAMIDSMDQGIGQVMSKLDTLGIDENTLILFLSDNGGCESVPKATTAGSDPSIPAGPKGGYHGYGPEWANASNTPFRKFKRFTNEGGISTPLLARWPATIKAGGKTDRDIGHVIDLLPTILDVTDSTYPENSYSNSSIKPEGLSLAPSFKQESRPLHQFLYWEHTGNRAVRTQDWKLVGGRNGPWELYRIDQDRTEMRNLAPHEPDIVQDLAQRYEKWAQRTGVLPWPHVAKKRAEFNAAKKASP